MYAEVKSRVRCMNGESSDAFICNLGVRQGECLSPFLFAIYLNDLDTYLKEHSHAGVEMDIIKMFLVLYADGACILADSAAGLQSGLNSLHDYCVKWNLTLNTDKTKVMVFKRGGTTDNEPDFVYNNVILEKVESFCYLGIIFTSKGSFDLAQKTLAAQARKSIYTLRKYVSKFVNINSLHMCDLFDKLVKPVLCYGCEAWGFIKGTALEHVHKSFCKSVLGVKNTTLNEFVYGELGRMPLIFTKQLRMVKYWL